MTTLHITQQLYCPVNIGVIYCENSRKVNKGFSLSALKFQASLPPTTADGSQPRLPTQKSCELVRN